MLLQEKAAGIVRRSVRSSHAAHFFKVISYQKTVWSSLFFSVLFKPFLS